MPLPASLLLLATLLPLAAFVVLLFLGTRMGRPFAGYFATAAIAGSFICCIVATIAWLGGGTYLDPLTDATVNWGAGGSRGGPIYLPLHWLPSGTASARGPAFLDLGIYVDSLTVALFSMVTAIATFVHIFSLGYMADDARYPRFFTYLSLFCFSMLGLVLSGTLLHWLVFWELVGLCSYLLIGFWHERKAAANAAVKAFVVNRIGDVGLLVGMGLLLYHVGNVSLPGLWTALGDAGRGGDVPLADGTIFRAGLLTATGICLFFGTIAKSAQFPLHVWLPGATEAPTPASALLHGSTMVAAGVYFVGRIFPLLTPDARLFVAIIGCITLTMAGLIALAQRDLKRLLAYGTISQVGYMMLAMGVGSWAGGLFHLFTHAFFNALLFLGAGSVILAAGGEREMRRFGGLMRKIPVTAVTFLVAVLAIAGTPLLSGYYSRQAILHDAAAFAARATAGGGSVWYWALIVLPTATAYLTAFYMMRCWVLTFWGRPRDETLHARAGERPSMYVPLGVLAVLSVIVGYRWFGGPQFLSNAVSETTVYCQRVVSRAVPVGSGGRREGVPQFHGFKEAWTADELAGTGDDTRAKAVGTSASAAESRGAERVAPFASWPFYAFAVGLGLAFALYAKGESAARWLYSVAPLRAIHTWLHRGMYFDDLYAFLVPGVTLTLARLAAGVDRWLIDAPANIAARGVKKLADLAGRGGRRVAGGPFSGVGFGVRSPESERVRLYVALVFGVIVVTLAGVIIVLAL